MRQHPSTKRTIHRRLRRHGIEISLKRVANMVSRWKATGLLKKVGEYKEKPWQARMPEEVFCNGFAVSPANMRHEMKLTEYAELWRNAEWLRGPNLSPYKEDAQQIYPWATYRIELDCATETKPQVIERARKYLGTDKRPACADMVLWVVSAKYGDDEDRLKKLAAWCGEAGVWPMSLFTTLVRLQQQGINAKVWQEFGRGPDGTVTMTPRRVRDELGDGPRDGRRDGRGEAAGRPAPQQAPRA